MPTTTAIARRRRLNVAIAQPKSHEHDPHIGVGTDVDESSAPVAGAHRCRLELDAELSDEQRRFGVGAAPRDAVAGVDVARRVAFDSRQFEVECDVEFVASACADEATRLDAS